MRPVNTSHHPTRRAACALLLALPLPLLAVDTSGSPVVLGVVPYLSTRKLAELYEPLRGLLAVVLGRQVVLESAPDYTVFLERTALGQYDVVATSPYFGRLAQREQSYLPLARPVTNLEPLLVTLKTSRIDALEGLRHQVVTTSDRLANLTLAAHQYLTTNRLRPGLDVTLRPMGSHANSLAALEAGESAAAVVSATALTQIGGNWPNRIRVLARMAPLPPLLYLAHQRLGTAAVAELQRRMLAFANDQPAGQRFCEALGHGGLQPISEADMKTLDPFVNELKHLKAPRQ